MVTELQRCWLHSPTSPQTRVLISATWSTWPLALSQLSWAKMLTASKIVKNTVCSRASSMRRSFWAKTKYYKKKRFTVAALAERKTITTNVLSASATFTQATATVSAITGTDNVQLSAPTSLSIANRSTSHPIVNWEKLPSRTTSTPSMGLIGPLRSIPFAARLVSATPNATTLRAASRAA